MSKRILKWLPWAVGAACALAYLGWMSLGASTEEKERVPLQWDRTAGARIKKGGQVGDVTTFGPGKPSLLAGNWPQFRGARRDNIVDTSTPLARAWPAGGPKVLWRIAVGEGFAGAAINQGRVFLLDYDRDKELGVIRCLSLDDGREIWRTAYPETIKRNHGMTRTIPALSDRYVVTLSPRCQVYCCDTSSGQVIWKKNLKSEFGAVEPPWYAGQCPLIDGDRVILAPGAKPLMMAVELATGKVLWQTKDHADLGMTHSSIVAATIGGIKQYIYCAHEGALGVAADDGRVLWTHPDWKINMATIPSPLPVGGDQIFFSGGYGSGCQMVKLIKEGDGFKVQEVFRLKVAVFGADQQTPILFKDHIYGVIPPSTAGELACLDLSGRRLWTSGGAARFGLGPFLMTSDGLMLALSDQKGTLHLATVDPSGYKELAQAKLLSGADAWGPLALAGGRLVLRDMTEMICVDLGQ